MGPIISTPTGKMLNQAYQPKTRRMTWPYPQFPGKGSEAQGQGPAPDSLRPALQEALAIHRHCDKRTAHSVLAVRRQGSEGRVTPPVRGRVGTTQPSGSRDQANHHVPWLPLKAGEHLHKQVGRGHLGQRQSPRKSSAEKAEGGSSEVARNWTRRVAGGRLQTGGSWTVGHWWPRSNSFATDAKAGA